MCVYMHVCTYVSLNREAVCSHNVLDEAKKTNSALLKELKESRK